MKKYTDIKEEVKKLAFFTDTIYRETKNEYHRFRVYSRKLHKNIIIKIKDWSL